MKTVRLTNATRGGVICENCRVADNLWTRGKGLLGRKDLPQDEGILLVPGTSIHMFGMKFSIDVIFLTKDDIVTDFATEIAPGKAHIAKAGAGKPHSALEVAAGTIARCGVQIGDALTRSEV